MAAPSAISAEIDRPGRRLGPTLAVLIAAALFMVSLAFILPVDHDEGQYVAAASLAARGLRPYADFIYLQTPLQPFLTAPVARLASGETFIALRLVNALAGAGVLALVFLIQRRLGVGTRRAAIAAVLLGACYIFQFGCGVARNDALPVLAEVLALSAALAGLRDAPKGGWRAMALWLLAGLGLGAAVSLKVSYALPLAGAGLFVLTGVWRRTLAWPALPAFSLGALAGVAPCLAALGSFPEAYVFDTLGYHATAPRVWYAAIGQSHRLSPLAKIPDGLFALAVGPALEVLAAVVALSVLRFRAGVKASPQRRLIEILALAGLAAALAPTPTQRQYFLPLLPFLFILWGLGEAGLRRQPSRRLSQVMTAAIAVGALIGAGRYAYLVGDSAVRLARRELPPILQVTNQAHWLGRRLAGAGVRGDIVTPSPQVVADSGYPLDPRLAAGPFFYRTGDLVSDGQQRRLHGISPRSLAAFLDEVPAAAIVIGLEPRQGPSGRSVDDDFRAYATARGYRRENSPTGSAELFIRP